MAAKCTTFRVGLHPAAASRVQKLRVGAPFRVPKFFGFTMPSKEKEAEVNALFKSVIFRPLQPAEKGCGLGALQGRCRRVWEA